MPTVRMLTTAPPDSPQGRQRDRARGVLLGAAAGDALGAGYESGPPLGAGASVDMIGGGPFNVAPGEWTDDTAMAIPLARALAEGRRIEDLETLDHVVAEWYHWHLHAPSVGTQTRRVLGGMRTPSAAEAWESSRRTHVMTGRSGGNGSLMRTAPVALAYLGTGQETALVDAATRLSQLTHWDQDAADACALWCLAIRWAVLTGHLDLRAQLHWLPAERREVWAGRIAAAEASTPERFTQNTWVVEAFQGAWSAVHHGACLRETLDLAVRGGHDTDTVAAIAGALTGAAHGASAVPTAWRDMLHGWPELAAEDLELLGLRILEGPHATA
ncbi:ADP-ribosylglycohydrolase family protein [Zhihengliuella flava]|uniref:ADP-ribosylglycohydrolase n=1 Tax=Zhihengliuella flava TaxID=1285193 RepID=A0A931GM64_9MICC|nr:ADP-ribosylglycohydrolase family protein [Zhihengliuella flava]MBG6085114.1 ADP-ribosylglycohydrolase [Zhihengliuella flava]